MIASRLNQAADKTSALDSFDQTKLSIFVKRGSLQWPEKSVDKERSADSLDKNDLRNKSRGLPGIWQEAIEEEGEDEQELSKLKDLEQRRNNQKTMVTPQKPGKLKLNFSLWERNDGFASKRAIKRIFINKTGLPSAGDTNSSNKKGNQGNTTLDSSDQNTLERQDDSHHERNLSIMTDFSNSAGTGRITKTRR